MVAILVLCLSFARQADGQEIINSAPAGTPKTAGQDRKQVDLKDYYDPSSPTAGLQAAIDQLKPEGGIVHIPPGSYKIRRSVFLASGITLLGSGEHSVIERMDPCVQRRLLSAGKGGDKEIQLEDVGGFFPGGEVTVFSRRFAGFNCTAAVIVEVKEKSLVLDRPLRRDYLPEDQAGVVNFFPAFTVRQAEKIQLEKLAIDGGMEPGSAFLCDFVCSAIHLVHVKNITIDRVTVRNYPGDGFSIQGGSNAYVTNCLAEHNLGNGFHPGTTLHASKWTHNTGRFNGKDGLFFCFNVRYATVADNHFYNNRKNGIGDLGKGGDDGDQMNVVSGNYCYNNGLSGIECTSGGNNTVINNICENNSRSEPGKWPGIYLSDTHSTIVQGNRCAGRDPATKSNGILLVGQCENNLITSNILAGYPVAIAGDNLAQNTVGQNLTLKEFKEGKSQR
jgi:parallel beta-helix repeat protein